MFKSALLKTYGLLLMLGIIVPAKVYATWPDSIPDLGQGVDSTLIFLQVPTFNRMLDRAIDYQHRADALERIAIKWRKEAAKMDDPIKRGRLQKRIMQSEDSVEIYTRLANEHFRYLNASLPGGTGQGSVHHFLIKDTVLDGITVYMYDLNEEFMSLLSSVRAPVTMESSPEYKDPRQKPAKDKAARDAAAKLAASRTESSKGDFKILDASPYGKGKPFERDFSIPQGVFYRIQLAVYSKQLPESHFGGLSPITTEAIPGRGLTRYFVGKFTHMDEARTALVKVRSLGYPDAFIIGYYDGKRSSFSKLKALEK